jgi:hypothetical protein
MTIEHRRAYYRLRNHAVGWSRLFVGAAMVGWLMISLME